MSRKRVPLEDRLIAQVARMYYDRQMTRMEIASSLGISRFRVARMLALAIGRGIVRIEFRDLPTEDRALARDLETGYGLAMCAVVADASPDDPQPLATTAAAILNDLVKRRDVIGVGWGSTLASVVREVPPRNDPTVEVVQMVGSTTGLGADWDPGQLARRLADRLGGHASMLFAPALVDSLALRSALMDHPEIQSTMALWARMTVAVIGIGAIPVPGEPIHSSLFGSGVLREQEIEGLRGRGVVGDIIVHPLGADGSFVAPEVGARAMAISVQELRQVPRVVAVAGGAAKVTAVRAALRSGVVDVLVTDQVTARGVLAAP